MNPFKYIFRKFFPKTKTPLEGARLYLSGPIEYGPSINWRVEPIKTFRERFKIDVFDPFSDPKQQWAPLVGDFRKEKNYDKMAEIAKMFVRKDLAMVDRADFVIAYLPKGIPTCGTHHEIINSVNAKKPTLLVCPDGKHNAPLWYYGFIPHHVIFGSWEELYQYLDEVNLGLHKDNNRWAFVYGMV